MLATRHCRAWVMQPNPSYSAAAELDCLPSTELKSALSFVVAELDCFVAAELGYSAAAELDSLASAKLEHCFELCYC
ncbi:hypothetical protein SLEP1_g15180 [Rubroshorea leprosula]|uniref:Uncharacterized protein n=1 Tax=Rubroshorea leprosula TaxID=152421 RepID=A0AAV5IVY2_9ROSI|nr:hypothetical protein SLEP1_g15180 [Rubroshorea leprosula]